MACGDTELVAAQAGQVRWGGRAGAAMPVGESVARAACWEGRETASAAWTEERKAAAGGDGRPGAGVRRR